MHKRTLYITDDSYQKVLSLSQSHQTSHADILRKAVELGLDKMDKDTPIQTKTEASQKAVPFVITTPPQTQTPPPPVNTLPKSIQTLENASKKDEGFQPIRPQDNSVISPSDLEPAFHQSGNQEEKQTSEEKGMGNYVESQLTRILRSLFK